MFAGQVDNRQLMDDDKIAQLVAFFDGVNAPATATLILFAYEFLCRVQSEVFPLEARDKGDLVSLPPHRQSGCWIDEQLSVNVRWQRRKNRPKGSHLKRPCTCSSTGNSMCLPHRMATVIGEKPAGAQIWSVKQNATLKFILRVLRLCDIKHAEQHRWTSFRSGKATQMAVSGCSLQGILTAGEWNSASDLKYVNEEVGEAHFFRMALEEDEDSGSDSETIAETGTAAEGDVGSE